MRTNTDHTIAEPLNAVLRLRADLRIEQRRFGGQQCHVIEDPLRGKFYRLGIAEHTFVALLDGKRTLQSAIRDAAGLLREQAFNEGEALGICRWLLENELVEIPGSVAHARLAKTADVRPFWRTWLQNPLSVRIPVFNPTAALDLVEPRLRWTLCKPFFLAWLACSLYALFVAATNWEELTAGAVVLLGRRHWWLLVAAWLLVKLCHETYHALVCRKYGGTVSEAGVFVLFFAPVPYVDVTSSWRFASKWPRIATAAAGIYAEIFVAAMAIIVWAHTGNAATRHVAASVAAMASLGTVLVNANPLMRFDGYFVLADLLEIPNLNMHGRRWLGSLISRLLGCRTAPLGLRPREARIVKVYAVCAIAWRSIVWVTLMAGVLVLLARAHWILAAVGGLLFVAVVLRVPVETALRWLRRLPALSPKRVATTAVAALAAIAVLGYALVRPATVSAPGIIEYRPLIVVRAASPGFIREMLIDDGDAVNAGQRLVVLENRELLVQLGTVEVDIEKSIAHCRMLRQAGETAKEQAQQAHQAALIKKRDEISMQVKSLVVTAPAGGQIVGRNLDAWLGRYVDTGTELFRIGDEASKEVLVAIAQQDVELFQERSGAPLSVRIMAPGGAALSAMQIDLEPRGTTRAPHEALSSRLGGPLVVLAHDEPADPGHRATDELLEACFKASVPLSAEQSCRLRAGQLATIEFQTPAQSWSRRAIAQVERWFDRQLSMREARK